MSGNVFEWCWDWNGPYVNDSPYTDSDPKGTQAGLLRIKRGGSWAAYPLYCKASYRGENNPYDRNNNLGFRVARTIP
jgi:formylglycine-generating enzyme required for sulfatase activity